MKNSTLFSRQQIKFDGIQVLRGIAASMVVFSHIWTSVATFGSNKSFVTHSPIFRDLGSAGVDIFFVISGFIMYLTSANKLWDANMAKTFIIKRIVRIYPLYWIISTFLLILICTGLALRSNPVTIAYTISSYLLFPHIKPGFPSSYHPILDQGWTLSFEMYFYLVFSIGIFINGKSFFLLFLISFLSMSAILGTLFYNIYPPVNQLITSPLVIEFVLGVGLAKLIFALEDTSIFLSKPVYFNGILIVSGFIMLFLTGFFITNTYLRVAFWGPISTYIVFFAAMIPQLKSKFAGLLIYLGNASYSIYLTHGFFSLALGTVLKKGILYQVQPDLLIIISTMCAIFFCSFNYVLIEKPITVRIGKYLEKFFS